MSQSNTYRNTEFKFKTWTTWNHKVCTCYTCDDKTLLVNVDTVSFSTGTKKEMKARIDDYIDNAIHHQYLKTLNDRAAEEFHSKYKSE